ncbi:MAG: hypothetical protein JW849_04255 [Phycisphaerae bacterium]|nr:hypothetical protein [Phycisphaerae bacterium]
MRKKAVDHQPERAKKERKHTEQNAEPPERQKKHAESKARQTDVRESHREEKGSAGVEPEGVDGSGGKAGASFGKAAGRPSASADSARCVDRRALRRILSWALEACAEQQALILSAMDIVSGTQIGSADPPDRHASPGALLRATLAEYASGAGPKTPPEAAE